MGDMWFEYNHRTHAQCTDGGKPSMVGDLPLAHRRLEGWGARCLPFCHDVHLRFFDDIRLYKYTAILLLEGKPPKLVMYF